MLFIDIETMILLCFQKENRKASYNVVPKISIVFIKIANV